MNKFSAIVLAAGKGRRMQSEKSKVLHKVAGKPIIQRTVEVLNEVKPEQIIVVASDSNGEELKKILKGVEVAIQPEQLGTADAAGVGLRQVSHSQKDVAVLYGDDTAFYEPKTIEAVFNFHQKNGSKITFVTIVKNNPHGLGRILREGSKLVGIVEEKDATEEEKKIHEVNDGLYFFDHSWLKANLARIKPSGATAELYITDLIEIALEQGEKVETYKLEDQEQWHGINTQIELAKANFKLNKNIHIMGILGAGAVAVAGIAEAGGFTVTGCDLNSQSSYINSLRANIVSGHSKRHLKNISSLILSPAILKFDPENEEVRQARNTGIPVLTWEEFQGEILQEGKFTLAVAGAYGKSTTTAMIGKILIDANLDPTVEIGAKVLEWKKNYRAGNSKYYVCEADEYNDNFSSYKPDIAVILNISWEHPDYFKTEKDLEKSYLNFINNIKTGGLLITTDEIAARFKSQIKSDVKIRKIGAYPKVNLKIIGDFRQENVNAALTVATCLKIEEDRAKKSIEGFTGLGRRLETKGKVKNVEFFDDYAVQPYTIKTSANALREKYPDSKILLVLEPHTLTRVNKFFTYFIEALKNTKVDQIYITDVFAARERGNIGQLSQALTSKLGTKAKYTGSIKDTVHEIIKHIKSFDMVLTMGAGDSYKIYELVKNG